MACIRPKANAAGRKRKHVMMDQEAFDSFFHAMRNHLQVVYTLSDILREDVVECERMPKDLKTQANKDLKNMYKATEGMIELLSEFQSQFPYN